MPEHLDDPYPYYREMREAGPLHWSQAAGMWFVPRYAEASQLLKERRFSVAAW